MKKKVLNDVPESELNHVIEMFSAAGCQAVGSKQGDGLFTVTAECPENDAVVDSPVTTEAD
jgi:hypothetical protein